MDKFKPSPGCHCTYCTRLPLSPEQYHVSAKHQGEYGTCPRCEAGQINCKRKVTYRSRSAAWEAGQQYNELNEFKEPLTHYRCRNCLLWHLTHAKGKRARKKVEKARRHWLIKEKYGGVK